MDAVLFSEIILMIEVLVHFVYQNYHLKTKGITVNCLTKGEKSEWVKLVEFWTKMSSSLCPLVLAISFFYHSFDLYTPNTFCQIFFLCILIFGVLFWNLAILTMNTNWRAGIDTTARTKLVTSGVYSYSRNPAFFGLFVQYISLALLNPNPLLLGFTVLSVVVLDLQTKEEEKHLTLSLGAEYTVYKDTTPRYILL
ncbi:hypothetical protein EIN_228680 [Entamoeba invadens IP1]|uniref:Protein-S-isoprenylcysteine O-methyltransferase n=1 Tax=Entamoeba invadens IP1 TaxID=370355 RepID=A0A0A1U669_ENTIV|nr:hypothetical protein EIN_228680 [Entamoeba invadens IP1]ELP88385.1 hypothetical protein EIN_228680 [Entamoeba invadens IP1]|eukprot:XP_004255156.1 hypothetical protein EIN_228680 [Entamoeba invadens IP1]